MNQPLTRRAALVGAAGSLALAATIAAPAACATTPAAISPALLDLLHAAEEAEAAYTRFHREVYDPAAAKRESALAAAHASVPHITVDGGPNVAGGRVTWSSERPQMAHTVLGMADEGREWSPEYLAAARRIVANDLRRKRAIARAERAHDTGPLVDQSNASSDACCAANDAVGAFPAATPADLHAKLAFMVANSMGDGVDWLPELLADAARIAGEDA